MTEGAIAEARSEGRDWRGATGGARLAGHDKSATGATRLKGRHWRGVADGGRLEGRDLRGATLVEGRDWRGATGGERLQGRRVGARAGLHCGEGESPYEHVRV